VLAEACREAGNWTRLSPSAPFVSVNLAVRQVHAAGLADQVRELLQQTGLPADRLQLEITESAMMSTSAGPVRTLRVLSDLGVRIAIDDLGTGYSNLAYLRDLPLSGLKLAASFVAGLASSASDPASRTDERILETLVSLGHALNLTVTAEGVETPEQAERLRAIGCDAAQGWHFGEPAPATRVVERLRERER
jgi:EAL domain-containing protein (putative c-di-GMP-specific phosphodiesterase class I)